MKTVTWMVLTGLKKANLRFFWENLYQKFYKTDKNLKWMRILKLKKILSKRIELWMRIFVWMKCQKKQTKNCEC